MLRHSATVFCWQLHTFVHRGRRKEEQDICSALQNLLHLAGLPGVDSLDLSIANNSAKLLLFALQCYINQNMHTYLLVNPPHIGTTQLCHLHPAPPKIGTTSLGLAHAKSLQIRVTPSVRPGKVHNPTTSYAFC